MDDDELFRLARDMVLLGVSEANAIVTAVGLRDPAQEQMITDALEWADGDSLKLRALVTQLGTSAGAFAIDLATARGVDVRQVLRENGEGLASLGGLELPKNDD